MTNTEKDIATIKAASENTEIVMLCRFGSHLYGTDTPDSDTDYKGIFLPTKHMTLMGEIPKSINNNKKKSEGERNTKHDVDFELYSLHYFIYLACKGETAAMDMLHVNKENLLIGSKVWNEIVERRESFYTKNLKAFVGYARKQAAKYGIKGSRLNAAKEFIKLLADESDHKQRMSTLWYKLPLNEHCHYTEDNPQGIKQYQICGKIIQETVTLKYAQEIILKYYQEYGERAKLAAENKNIDWKAVSHAMRAAYQVKEIFTARTITFPLKQAEYIKSIKLGHLDFKTQVQPKLERLLSALELYSERSLLPETIDEERWKSFVHWVMNSSVIPKKFNISRQVLRDALIFSKRHGHPACGTITLKVIDGWLGNSFTAIGEDKAELDITDIDCW